MERCKEGNMAKQRATATQAQKERMSDVYLDYGCHLTVRKAKAKNKNSSHANARLRQNEKD